MLPISRVVLLLLVAASVLATTGCYHQRLMSYSPYGMHAAELLDACAGPDCTIEVRLYSGTSRQTLIWKTDCIINFAHFAWSPDGRLLGVYIAAAPCSNVQQGFDLQARSPVPFEQVKDLMRRSIIREYQLTPLDLHSYLDDPLVWGGYPGDGILRPGMEIFQRRHP